MSFNWQIPMRASRCGGRVLDKEEFESLAGSRKVIIYQDQFFNLLRLTPKLAVLQSFHNIICHAKRTDIVSRYPVKLWSES